MNLDYDFFNDNNQREIKKEEQNMVGISPRAPEISVHKKKRNKGKTIGTIALALLIFLSGMWTTWAMLDPEIRTLLSIKNKIQDNYYQEITDEDFYKAIFGGINNGLLDAYSEYMTPEEFAKMLDDMEGNRIGVGLVFTMGQDTDLCIRRVCGNSPAEEAGIAVGETIVGCGETEENVAVCTTFEEFSAFLQNYGEGEPFYLQLRANGEDRMVKLYKSAYVENQVFYRTNDSAYAFTGGNATVLTEQGNPLTCLDDDTAYIRLVQFSANAATAFDVAMQQFKKDGKKNLILDLRENGGGYLDIMQSIASYFCKNATGKTPIVAVADYGEKRERYKATGNYYKDYFAEDSRICVLADAYTASASECLIGCMLDYGAIAYKDICLAERGGVAKTYGKGIMQETTYVNLFKQDAITLTTAEIRWPVSDNSIHGRGVLPKDGALTVAGNIDYEKETVNAIKTLLG